MSIIKCIELNEFGRAQKVICPECGQTVEIIEQASSTGRLKGLGVTHHDYGVTKAGVFSCGHKYSTAYVINNDLNEKFNVICRALELADEIDFWGPTGVHELEAFADTIYEMYPKAKRTGNFKEEEYNRFLEKFPEIENFLSGANWKLHKKMGSKEINEENIIIKYSKRTVFDTKELSFTLEEYDNLTEKDREDERYEFYLFNLLKEVFPVYVEDYPGKMCPIDPWDIPEDKRIQVAEFTIDLYRNRE